LLISVLFRDVSAFSVVPEVVVIDLDSEDDARAGRGDEVREEQRPDDLRLVQQPLQHKAEGADGHHQECRQRDAVRLTCTNRMNSLWEIPQNHADAGCPATHLVKNRLFHISHKGSDFR